MSKQAIFPTFYAVGFLMRWIWRLLRPLLAAMALALLAGYVILNMSAGRALESELAQIREKGEPISLREAAPPAVPDDENAALIYKQAFEHLPRLVPASPSTGRMKPQLSPDDERVLRRLLADRSERPGNVSMQEVREVLAGTDAALELFRKAAAMPRCRFPVDWEAGAGALFPHYTELLALARLMGAHAILAAHDGDPTASMADLAAIVDMTRHLAGEPIMIGLLIQYRCLYIAGNSLEQVLETTAPTETECRQLEQQLAKVDLDDSFERAVESERCLGQWCFDVAARSDPAKLPGILGVDHPILWLSTRLGPVGRPLLKMDELFYLRAMAREVDRAKQRDRRLPAKSAEADVCFPWYATISRVMFPALERVRERQEETRAGLALARCGLALNVCRRRIGQFPASLTDAQRAVGWSLPNDPVTGRELVYHPQGGGYLLYSLGLNGRDDGGRNTKERRHSAASPFSPAPDDVAWWFGSEPGAPG